MLWLLTSFDIFKTLYNLALIALFMCVFCTQKMKHPSSFYFQEYIYQKHSKMEEGKKKTTTLHCSKQTVTLRRLLENSITFLLCLQYAQTIHCYFLEVTEDDFSDLGRNHT